MIFAGRKYAFTVKDPKGHRGILYEKIRFGF